MQASTRSGTTFGIISSSEVALPSIINLFETNSNVDNIYLNYAVSVSLDMKISTVKQSLFCFETLKWFASPKTCL